MNMKLATPKGQVSSHIRSLQDSVRRLQPVRSVGTSCTQTVDGVIRSARPRQQSVTTESDTPRWG